MSTIPSLTTSRRRSAHALLRGVAVTLFVTLLPTVAAAEPAQSIDSLREQAAKIAAELDALDERTNSLDEAFNNASLELATLQADLDENQAAVDAAKGSLESTRSDAKQLAIEAFVGTDDTDTSLLGGIEEADDASRRRTYLAAKYGDSEDVIDGLVASQKDLADQESKLNAARDAVNAKATEIAKAKDELEATIADRQALQRSVEGDLADALAAEQARLAREAAAKAQAEAEAAAARAAAARRPQAVAVRSATPGSATAASVVAEAPVGRTITPPPANAPQAVQVALAQQGDPYRWAASGPDSFDCSGLVMYAYKGIISLPHSSRALRSMTRSLTVDELQPGDLVFGGSPVHHVGIYIGNGEMVHAPHSGDVVKVSGIYSTSKPVSFGRL